MATGGQYKRVLPIAHAGHWAIWALYLVPVVIVLGSIVAQLRRERAEVAEDGSGDEADNPADVPE
jgi:hypothetical protein